MRRARAASAARFSALRLYRLAYSSDCSLTICFARLVIRSGVTMRGSRGSVTRPGICIAPGGL
jgi:hypothetical protein